MSNDLSGIFIVLSDCSFMLSEFQAIEDTGESIYRSKIYFRDNVIFTKETRVDIHKKILEACLESKVIK